MRSGKGVPPFGALDHLIKSRAFRIDIIAEFPQHHPKVPLMKSKAYIEIPNSYMDPDGLKRYRFERYRGLQRLAEDVEVHAHSVPEARKKAISLYAQHRSCRDDTYVLIERASNTADVAVK